MKFAFIAKHRSVWPVAWQCEALGISRLGLSATQALDANGLSGTLFYLAPELLAGQVPTVRSDIYALGVVLYQVCVGDFRRPMSPGWARRWRRPSK